MAQDEPNISEAMDEVHSLAHEQLDRELALEPRVRWSDGTIKSASGIRDKELRGTHLPPAILWQAFSVARSRYLAAQNGFVYLGGTDLRHIDSLTPADLPRLRSTVEAQRAEFEAYKIVDDRLMDIYLFKQDLGLEIDLGSPFDLLL